jgi:hypothetical protein
VRVLLDENIPHDLIPQLAGHDVSTVQGLGWAGIKNGDLLERARGTIDVFVTMDRKLEKQPSCPHGQFALSRASCRHAPGHPSCLRS